MHMYFCIILHMHEGVYEYRLNWVKSMNFINGLLWNSCSRWGSPLQLACSLLQKTNFICPGWLIACLKVSIAWRTLFPFIAFPASQISHLRPWEIQYLKCEVYCLIEWKEVDATDNCYRQKDNYRSFGSLSKRMTCLCWFRFKSSDVLYTLLAVPFSPGAFIWCLILCHKRRTNQFEKRLVLIGDSSCF